MYKGDDCISIIIVRQHCSTALPSAILLYVYPSVGSSHVNIAVKRLDNVKQLISHSITAFMVVQAVMKANSQSNGKGQILTLCGFETPERISMKLGIYHCIMGTTT